MTAYSNLDISLMNKGVKLFEGTHYFSSYCSKPNKETKLIRTIDSCQIIENHLYQANFFPSNLYFESKRKRIFEISNTPDNESFGRIRDWTNIFK